jgi:uncharacterized protein (TIGR00255 family)
MPHSMTGFATADVVVAPFRLSWEIRSVNHRFLELACRVPEELRELEPACRDTVGAAIKRGKVDCTLRVAVGPGASQPLAIVEPALRGLKELQDRVRGVFPDARALSTAEVLRFPGVLKEPGQEMHMLAAPAKACLAEAIAGLQAARQREGSRIVVLLEQRLAGITALTDEIRPLLDGAQTRYRERLTERLQRFDVQVQPDRIEQELALLAQRVDVAEEVDRLASHITEIRDVLRRDEPIGRRLDFLIQELNREANTLASKVQDETLTRAAVELKVLIEQMREQVQNLE